MPYSFPCAVTSCDGYTESPGQLCAKCQQKADAEARDWRGVGWTRREDNESAKQGHKHNTKKEGKK